MPELKLSKELCDEFNKNPNVNPVTKRKISKDGKLYKQIENICTGKNKVKDNSIKERPTRPPRPPRSLTPLKPLKVFFVFGFGCNEKNIYIGDDLLRDLNFDGQALCNTDLKSTILTIAKTVCFMKPGKTNKFIQNVLDILEKNKDYNIVLCGASYGGAVVSTIAEIYDDPKNNKDHSNIAFLTFGSIYTYEPKNVKLRHLMFTNDVALKCNKLTPNKEKYIDWLEPIHVNKNNKRTLKDKIVGSPNQWRSHNAYMMEHFLKAEILQITKEKFRLQKRY